MYWIVGHSLPTHLLLRPTVAKQRPSIIRFTSEGMLNFLHSSVSGNPTRAQVSYWLWLGLLTRYACICCACKLLHFMYGIVGHSITTHLLFLSALTKRRPSIDRFTSEGMFNLLHSSVANDPTRTQISYWSWLGSLTRYACIFRSCRLLHFMYWIFGHAIPTHLLLHSAIAEQRPSIDRFFWGNAQSSSFRVGQRSNTTTSMLLSLIGFASLVWVAGSVCLHISIA